MTEESKSCYDIKDNMDGIGQGVCLLLVQNYADDAVIKNNSDMLMKFATENQGLFHKYFTVNGGGQCSFIRGEFDMVELKLQHPCPLVKQQDNSTAYAESQGWQNAKLWRCSNCEKSGGNCKEQHHCKECEYDLCEDCVLELNKPIADEFKEPVLIVLDLANNHYFNALNPAVNEESIKVLADDFKKGNLKAIILKSER